MERKIWWREDPILILYFITAAILLLDVTNNFPMISLLRKIKYVLIFFIFLSALRERSFSIDKHSMFVLVFLYLHTVIFGYIFINPDVSELTATHAREMLIYLVFLTLTVEMIERKKCYVAFLECIVAAFAVFFVWTGVTHFGHFVNPIYFPMALIKSGRIRSDFGTASPNYLGYYAFVACIFYYLLWTEWKTNNLITKKKMGALLIVAFWTVCMLLSTGSRSSIISLLIFAAVCFLTQFKGFSKKKRKAVIVFCLIAATVVLICNWQNIWSQSNREANVSVNMPVFQEMNATWTGMGYVESSGFYGDVYGYDTFPVDIYYLYIFLTTGVIGSVLIFLPLIYILIVYIKKQRTDIQNILLAAYIALLFDGFWQVNIFTYRYIGTLFINALLLYFMGVKNEGGAFVEQREAAK